MRNNISRVYISSVGTPWYTNCKNNTLDEDGNPDGGVLMPAVEVKRNFETKFVSGKFTPCILEGMVVLRGSKGNDEHFFKIEEAYELNNISPELSDVLASSDKGLIISTLRKEDPRYAAAQGE